MSWRKQAACADHHEPLWDETVYGETPAQRAARFKAAVAICQGCPVKSECLADVNWSIDEGIRGGILLPLKKTAYRARYLWPAWAREAAS